MITGKAPYISTVSLLNRPVNTAAAGAMSAPGGTDPNVSPVSPTDSVQLSDPSLNLLPENTAETDPARAERVQAIKQAVEEKRYHIESRKIAERLLQEASELLGTLTGYPTDPLEEKLKAAESGNGSEQTTATDTADQPVHTGHPAPARSTRSYLA